MSEPDTLDALRRANPRGQPDFNEWAGPITSSPTATRRRLRSRFVIGIHAATTALVAAAVTLIAVGSPVGPLAISPAAAMEQAVNASARAAESSGTVQIEITENGALWVGKTLRWDGTDLSISGDDPSRVGRGDLLVVGGVMYGPHPEVAGGWIELGPPDSVDPDSGTTPAEYLAPVAEDAGGETMRRITAEMTELTTSQSEDGSTVYHGKVPAGALARESGVKEGETIRVLPYGNVAHDDASDPTSSIDISITVGPDGTIREIHATWGGGSAWSYRLIFSNLGTTGPLAKPNNVEPCTRCWPSPSS